MGIATNPGDQLSALQFAKIGIYQITGQNSKKDYWWVGIFNTTSKEKAAATFMKLIYKID